MLHIHYKDRRDLLTERDECSADLFSLGQRCLSYASSTFPFGRPKKAHRVVFSGSGFSVPIDREWMFIMLLCDRGYIISYSYKYLEDVEVYGYPQKPLLCFIEIHFATIPLTNY